MSRTELRVVRSFAPGLNRTYTVGSLVSATMTDDVIHFIKRRRSSAGCLAE